jgi:sugar (pentulose or hexulose) kinase
MVTRLITNTICALCLLSSDAFGQNATSVTVRVSLLKEIVETVGAAGDALGKLTEGVQKLVIAGDKAWNRVSAERTRDRLADLSAATSGLATMQVVQTIPAIEQFVNNPSAATWNVVVRRSNATLEQVYDILRALKSEKSDLVFQPAYSQLERALEARASLLARLVGLPTPHTREELAEIRNLITAYKVLVIKLESARDELNRYAVSQN